MHLSAHDLPFAAAKNFSGLTVSSADPKKSRNAWEHSNPLPGGANRLCQVPTQTRPCATFCGSRAILEGAALSCIPLGSPCVAAVVMRLTGGCSHEGATMTDGGGGVYFLDILQSF